MNSEAYRTSTVGEIVNLMSVDAQSMQNVTGMVWMVWSCPLQISVSIYMLWGIVGPSVLAGVAVIVLMIPVNAFMATMQRKLQVILRKTVHCTCCMLTVCRLVNMLTLGHYNCISSHAPGSTHLYVHLHPLPFYL